MLSQTLFRGRKDCVCGEGLMLFHITWPQLTIIIIIMILVIIILPADSDRMPSMCQALRSVFKCAVLVVFKLQVASL